MPHVLTNQPALLKYAYVHICIYRHLYVHIAYGLFKSVGEEISWVWKSEIKGLMLSLKVSRVSAHPCYYVKGLMQDFMVHEAALDIFPVNIVFCCIEDTTSVESESWGERTLTDNKVKFVFVHSSSIWRV